MASIASAQAGAGRLGPMSDVTVVPSEGWGVLHLFFHLRRELLEDPAVAAADLVARLDEMDARTNYQVLAFSVLGQKADLGLMVLGPNLAVLDRFTAELAASPIGAGLLPAASYLSMTERSEYTSTEADESRRLVAEEGLVVGTPEHSAALDRFRSRMTIYLEHRLRPSLPRKPVISFYPMSKRRGELENWYTLPFEERKSLMLGHAKVGMTYRGRVLQLITGSVGLDDWEWGVTLLADDPKAIKDIVYEMRFDDASARFAEFGPFVTGLVMEPKTLVGHLGLV